MHMAGDPDLGQRVDRAVHGGFVDSRHQLLGTRCQRRSVDGSSEFKERLQDRDPQVATLKAGDHFGAMALFATVGAEHSTRSATITADADMWISVMSMGEFSSLVTQFPDVADQLREVAARRRDSNETIKLVST